MHWTEDHRQQLLSGTNAGRALPSVIAEEAQFFAEASRACQAFPGFTADALARCHAWVQTRAFNARVGGVPQALFS